MALLSLVLHLSTAVNATQTCGLLRSVDAWFLNLIGTPRRPLRQQRGHGRLCFALGSEEIDFLSAKPPSRATIPNSEQLDLRPGICQSQLFTSELLPHARPQAHQCTTNFRTSPKGNLMKTRCRAESQNPTCLLLPNPLVDTGRNRWKL